MAVGELLPGGRFKAEQVLAKHDENYMPPEVHDALKKGGTRGLAMGEGPRDVR